MTRLVEWDTLGRASAKVGDGSFVLLVSLSRATPR